MYVFLILIENSCFEGNKLQKQPAKNDPLMTSEEFNVKRVKVSG